jgi:ribosome-associated toxin RatA of RatAB toxin-antitoxin module
MRSIAVTVKVDDAGLPLAATAEGRIDRSVAETWKVIADVSRYPGSVPMIHRVRLDGDRATVELKFKVALFSVGFQFVVDVVREDEKSLELRWVSGEPRGINLRFVLEPLDGGTACLLRTHGEFDANSLGWLTKYFLRHHPEIQFGVIPGVAIGLFASMRRVVEG